MPLNSTSFKFERTGKTVIDLNGYTLDTTMVVGEVLSLPGLYARNGANFYDKEYKSDFTCTDPEGNTVYFYGASLTDNGDETATLKYYGANTSTTCTATINPDGSFSGTHTTSGEVVSGTDIRTITATLHLAQSPLWGECYGTYACGTFDVAADGAQLSIVGNGGKIYTAANYKDGTKTKYPNGALFSIRDNVSVMTAEDGTIIPNLTVSGVDIDC